MSVPADIGAKSRLTLDSKMSGVFTIQELTGSPHGLGRACTSPFILLFTTSLMFMYLSCRRISYRPLLRQPPRVAAPHD